MLKGYRAGLVTLLFMNGVEDLAVPGSINMESVSLWGCWLEGRPRAFKRAYFKRA